jgi:hypothetical protein
VDRMADEYLEIYGRVLERRGKSLPGKATRVG